ncbi:hypothetical protein BH18ACI2_BH18ACI2_03910 [soil metagenome]
MMSKITGKAVLLHYFQLALAMLLLTAGILLSIYTLTR